MIDNPIISILLVDDEPMILTALSRLLHIKGYRVLTTSQPTEVIDILEKEDIQILLSDVSMPKLKGTTLMSQIRLRFPGIVRILMTGQGSLDTVLQGINEGEVYRFLLKPFKNDELLTVLKEAVSRIKDLQRFGGIMP